jgi:hypothetical protein
VVAIERPIDVCVGGWGCRWDMVHHNQHTALLNSKGDDVEWHKA